MSIRTDFVYRGHLYRGGEKDETPIRLLTRWPALAMERLEILNEYSAHTEKKMKRLIFEKIIFF